MQVLATLLRGDAWGEPREEGPVEDTLDEELAKKLPESEWQGIYRIEDLRFYPGDFVDDKFYGPKDRILAAAFLEYLGSEELWGDDYLMEEFLAAKGRLLQVLCRVTSKEKDGEASARLRLLPENRSGQYRLIPDVEHGPHGEKDAKEAYLHPQSSEDFYDEILHSVGFNLFISGLIVANAIVIGLETDNQEEELWAIMEFVFLGIFTVELILRLIVSGPKKFFSYQNDDFSWNLFDFCVVFAGCLDVISDMSPVRHTKGSFMTFLRIIRLLRVMRMIRLLRFLRDFHVLTFGFAAAAVAIRNVSLLMLAAIYVSSTMLVRVILPFMQDNDHQEFLDAHFGTLRKSMLSLFFLLSEPDLMPYWEVLKDDGLLAAFLICFVVFVSFGIVGLLTGLVCESMFDKNDARVEQERAEAEEKRQRIIKNCEKIFETIASSQGHAAIEDIMQILPELDALFVEEGVTFAREDLVNTVNCMDTDGSNSIDRNEFCHSILHLAEGLRPISIMVREP
eukprot:symbB.v1.2.024231.t1/scaffold2249.1/size84557/2